MSPREYQQAVIDPGGAFAAPEEVLTRADLSSAEKLHLLHRWRDRARELSIAKAQGTDFDALSLLDRVSAALANLDRSALIESES